MSAWWAGVRRGIMFIVGIFVIVHAMVVDNLDLGLLFIGMLLMGVITWEQISAFANRAPPPDDTPPLGIPFPPPRIEGPPGP